MAFQDFDHISERRKNEEKRKTRKKIIIGSVSSIVVVCLIAAAICAVVVNTRRSNNAGSNAPPGQPKEISQSQKAIKMICAPTDFKQTCETSLSKTVGGSNSSASAPQPKDLLKAAISVAADELKQAIDHTSTLKFDTPELKAAFEDCMVLLADATEELNSSISIVDGHSLGNLSSTTPELNNWLSAVMSYRETCIDGFPEGELKSALHKALKNTRELTSNALAIINQLSSVFSNFPQEAPSAAAGANQRHLLSEDGLPTWMSHEDRRILKAPAAKRLTPNVVVAKDGSGSFRTISAALAAMPKKRQGRYVIYIKEGVYEEYVTVTKDMIDVTMYGDGSQKTIVTGSKNFVDKVPTFQTATFAALGNGFMAQSMGFRNTAGPQKHQAVALRVQSDRSIFLNCRMEAYQDTLYAQTHRQFYRSCVITGTVDFIFGDAASNFQNCLIYARRPLEGQQNIVTAQGRYDRQQSTGIVLQNCRILADHTLEPVKSRVKTYLGRPWKEFATTVVMESEIGDLIHPAGYLEWDGQFALKTLFYAEYNNKGPGANLAGRVKWPGFHVITRDVAARYTVGPFIQGDSWLKAANVPARFGLF